MPYVDYAEWYRQQQKLQGNTGSPYAAGGVNPEDRYQGYQRQRFGEIDREMGSYTKDVAIAGAKGAAAGGTVGAIINASIAAAPYYARAGRRSWDAAKEGDYEGVKRSLAPVSPLMYVQARLGNKQGLLGKYTDPMYYATKTVSELFGGPRTKIEEKRWDKLKDYGFEVPAWVKDKAKKPGVYRKEFGEDFIGTDAEGNAVNNKFAKSRNEADLTANDIKDFASNYEVFGDIYAKATDEEKKRIMQIALDNKLIQEARGTVQVNWNEETLKQATDILAEVAARNPDAQAGRKMWVMPTETAWKMPGAK